ncbi:hypothetical protein EC950183_3499, partial [Escherichia coli 95.0183]|jgi:hypothetical protein
MFKH